MMRTIPFVLILIAFADSFGQTQLDSVDYNRDVRPILSDNCYACHGPDENQRSTELRLDQRESAISDLGGYAAIVPGEPEKSELVRRIDADEFEVMPPSDHRKSLSEKQKAILKKWIEQGASFEQHWSFRPLKFESPPNKDNDKRANYIDHFVLKELIRLEIEPSPVADDRTLVRRLHFDLLGLPPSAEVTETFANSSDPNRYEKMVDQLLASPHFGEKLAVYWLDLVRYADSVGYHGDQPVSVSPYRDYVIDAFNDNMPFDQFTREQLAGDLLPHATLQQKIASGYNRLGMMSAEGGVQPKEYLAKYAADRVRTTASVWMGITLGCAECHDHKFDPLSTKEFYQFASFFADIKEKGLYDGAHNTGKWGPNIKVPEPWLAEKLKPIDAEIAELKAIDVRQSAAFIQGYKQWKNDVSAAPIHWQPMPVQSIGDQHKTDFQIESNQVSVRGNSPDKSTYSITFTGSKRMISGLRLNAMPDASLPQAGPGRAGNGNFVVTEVRLFKSGSNGKKQSIPLAIATATFEQTHGGNSHPDGLWSAKSTIDDNSRGDRWGWAVLPEVGKTQSLVIQLVRPISLLENENLVLSIEQNHGGQHTLGCFNIEYTNDAFPIVSNNQPRLPEQIAALVQKGLTQLNNTEEKDLVEFYLSISPERAELQKRLANLQAERAKVVETNSRTTLVTVSVEPRTMRVLPRGNWMDDSGEVVRPGTPAVFPPLDVNSGADDSLGRPSRLDLANWIVSRNNPLTSRVFVNRLWKMYFGTGLSNTLDDFGAQGEAPTHPELLDALAADFQSDWNIKRMIKTMVMSDTYRQSSMPRNNLQAIDPGNRLLARQSRFRLDAEFVRDTALAVSGLLVKKVGGRSVKPYQPAGLYRHLNFPTRTYKADTGDAQYRRGVYTHWQRQYLHPAMKAFDAPSREECTAQRPRSNTPLAALVLLNDPSFVEAARVFAESALQNKLVDDRKRIDTMVLSALGRPGNNEEVEILLTLLDSQRKYYLDHPDAAQKLVHVGQSAPGSSSTIHELAAWTAVARAIFNMHEFISRN